MGPFRIALWLAAAGVATAGQETPAPLTQAEMQPLLRALHTDYARPAETGYEALNRAALAGLLRDHPDTIQLVTVPDPAPVPAPLLSATLTPRLACLRPGALRPEDAAALREALVKLAATETATLILDLRVAAPDGEPATVAALAALFLPRDTPLFTLETAVKTAADPVWTRDLMVLIDRDTCNAGEILAATLQMKHRAFVIGTPSRGCTAAISSLPVRREQGGTLTLRFAGRPVIFAAGADPFGKGVVPDMPVALDDQTKAAVFALQAKDGLAAAVIHVPRPRVNEASLVAGVNPELPDRIARSARQPVPDDHRLTDRPLQVAMDIVVSNEMLSPLKKP